MSKLPATAPPGTEQEGHRVEPPHLIGLTGGRGAGKDTVARLLRDHHGFRTYAFADQLRDFVYSTNLGWQLAFDTHGYERAKTLVDGFRDVLDTVGQAARDHLGEPVWINALDARVARDLHTAQENFPVVVSDVRYRNEADYIRRDGGVVIGVDRPNHNPGDEQETLEVFLSADDWLMNHGSEVDLANALSDLVYLYS